MPVYPSISGPTTGSSTESAPFRCSAYAFSAMPRPPRSPMFSPIVSAPLTLWSPSRPSGVSSSYWAMRLDGALLERGAVVVRPPVAQRPVAVEAAALVVEAVADLVADDRADAAVVGRGVALGVEERVLQDRRREDDLVHQRVVVRVDRLRRHVPLVAVDRLADLAELAVVLVDVRAAHVADEVAGVDLERRVVLPLHRVADLGREGVELRERALAGLGAHPLELGDRLPVRLDEVRDELVHRRLRGRAGSAARRRRGRSPRPAPPRRGRRRASTARG